MVGYAEGIDVSGNNGDFPWSYWKGAASFAAIKATEGLSFMDGKFPVNWHRAGQEGMFRFAVHRGDTGLDPAEQAAWLTAVAGHAGLYMADHFVLDFYQPGPARPVDASFWAYVFLSEIGRLNPGRKVLVLTTPDAADAGYCAMLGQWPLWVMNWAAPAPVLPLGPWKTWTAWQYAGSGVGRDRFNGTPGDLQRFCETAT